MSAPCQNRVHIHLNSDEADLRNLMPIIQYRMNLPEVSDCPDLSRGASSSVSPAALVEVGPDICFGALICGFRLPFFLSVRVLTVSFMLVCRNAFVVCRILDGLPAARGERGSSIAKANRQAFQKCHKLPSALQVFWTKTDCFCLG